ncbi:unnamed protein product [Ectocarpus sp. CCAP 1310/34]|nr:unnamed protein product [Ectocarpus sp. CCAP 1310/34]
MRSYRQAATDVAPAAVLSLKLLTQLAVMGICMGTAVAGSTTTSSSAPRRSPATDARSPLAFTLSPPLRPSLLFADDTRDVRGGRRQAGGRRAVSASAASRGGATSMFSWRREGGGRGDSRGRGGRRSSRIEASPAFGTGITAGPRLRPAGSPLKKAFSWRRRRRSREYGVGGVRVDSTSSAAAAAAATATGGNDKVRGTVAGAKEAEGPASFKLGADLMTDLKRR